MSAKMTDQQKEILDADLQYILQKEETLKEKLKDSSHLERFAKDVMSFVGLLKDYYNGDYRDIPYKAISAAVVGLLYTLNPIDIIPDFIPFIGHIDDALVLAFCLKLIEKDLQKYQTWKENQSTTDTNDSSKNNT